MTTDIHTLIATVREGLRVRTTVDGKSTGPLAALDSLAAELERAHANERHLRRTKEVEAMTRGEDYNRKRADNLAAELERVKAERDAGTYLGKPATYWLKAEARLDKALTALRETRDELNTWLPSESSERLRKRIDAVIAELEGKA